MKSILVAILGLLAAIPVFAGEMELKTFTNTAPAYTVDYPADWQVMVDEESQTVQFRAPAIGPADLFSENVTIATEDLTGRPELQSLDAYVAENRKEIEAKHPEFKLEDEFMIRRRDVEFQCLEFTCTFHSVPVKIRQYIFVVGKTGCVLSYVAKPDTFDTYLAASYHIARSLKRTGV